MDLKTENEYWTQSSNMSALDTRGELIRHKAVGFNMVHGFLPFRGFGFRGLGLKNEGFGISFVV